jgi:Uma2 family endonuclease
LYVLPSHGGQVRIIGGYIEGAPEFVAEVAASSASYDLHSKKRVYLRNNVREYLVWRVLDQAIDWFVLQDDRYVANQPDSQGCYWSQSLPGLCLDAAALVRYDMATVMRRQHEALNDPRHAAFVAKLADFAARHPNA